MVKNPNQISLKMDDETFNKLNELVAHFEKESVGTVNKNIVMRKAIHELHKSLFATEVNK